jgi:phage replication-related protein YjqB (UPF0714/DUF867 family)
VFQELDKAKLAIADLEAELKSERARLRGLTTEQNSVQREKDNILIQLQRTESVSNTVYDISHSEIRSFSRIWTM